MISKRDIIVVGLQSLDSDIGSNCVNIANEFAKKNRVLYVNYALDRKTALKNTNNQKIIKRKKVIKGLESDLVKVSNNLWNLFPKTILESINQINSNFIFDKLNKINNKRFANSIKTAIDSLEFKNYIIFNDSDFYRSFYLKELLNPALLIYYTRDNMVATSYFKKHGRKYETKLMQKSDLITANSMYLQKQAKKFNDNAFYVGQGCDLSLFDKSQVKNIPDDIKKIKSPRVGYLGALKSSRLDIELLKQIAIKKPDFQIILVGPEDDKFIRSDLHKIENVHFLGSKKISELPSYLTAFDVSINPQAINELTIGNYPRKIDEYLAMGKPVVATKTSTMSVFSEYVYLSRNAEEYIRNIQKAITDNSVDKEKKRIEFARTHTWENSVNEIYKAISYTMYHQSSVK